MMLILKKIHLYLLLRILKFNKTSQNFLNSNYFLNVIFWQNVTTFQQITFFWIHNFFFF